MVPDLAVLELETLLVFRSPTPSSSLNYEDGGFSAAQLSAAKNGGPSWPQPRTSWTTTASGRPSRFCSTSKSCTGLQRLHRLHMDTALRTSSTWRKRTPGERDDGTSWAATAWEESSEWPEEPDGEVSLAEDSTPLDPEAMTADRTWSQAHKSTQMLRKDRGFGAASAKTDGCFICGNKGHMARECPDRNAKGGKGKGKGRQVYFSDEIYMHGLHVQQGQRRQKGQWQDEQLL